uniref:DUF1725 domain-containing protein n=1 Tax=Rhinolophus ferrumequinum TaxID=59479 RepID=A0A671FEW0_RHIFE
MWYLYIMVYYSAIKKNEILPFATTWMDLENIMLSEISQSEKDKYHISHLYLESKEQNKQTNITEIDSDTEKKLMDARWEVSWGMGRR